MPKLPPNSILCCQDKRSKACRHSWVVSVTAAQRQSLTARNMSLDSKKCEKCSELTTGGTYCNNCVCERCQCLPREDWSKECFDCLSRCEYCESHIASTAVRGCGKRMCIYCDDRYPKTRCLLCHCWHRYPHPYCDKCKQQVPYQAELNCYGACRAAVYGYSSCDCRYQPT